MTKRKPGKSCETQTALPLEPVPPLELDAAVKELLSVLYRLATEGNVPAAKLYLDVITKQKGEDTNALTLEEALRLIRDLPNTAAA